MQHNPGNYAVFGNPILHSKSPQIFNSAFQSEQINAHYTRIHAETAQEIGKLMHGLELEGANITTPFKETIMPYLSEIEQDAQIIGGVNTLIRTCKGLQGFNTDWIGVVSSIAETGNKISGQRCLVVGCGPAGRAAAYGLTAKGGNVTLINRTHEKALQFASKIICQVTKIENLAKSLPGFDIIVSSTLPDANPLQGLRLNQNTLVLDANYRPSVFRNMALEQGCRVISGKRWLLFQAQAALHLFTGKTVEINILERQLNSQPVKEKLKIGVFREHLEPDAFSDLDFIVSASQADNTAVKNIIEEEIRLAFQ